MATLLLLTYPGFTSQPDATNQSGLKLGLVDNLPALGFARIPLDQAVAQIRHNYGRFTLARFTRQQEEALRAAGHQIRVFEDPERVGIGFYSFRVPPGPLGLPPELTVDEGRSPVGTYLVKLFGPARDEWLGRIRSLGGEILTPIPEFTYLVRISPKQRGRLAALPFVEWTGPYHPAFKLHEELARQARNGTLSPEPEKLRVLVYRSGDVEAVLNRIRGMGAEILNRSPSDFYDIVEVRIPARQAVELVRESEVYAVEPAPEPQLEDESSAQILAGQFGTDGIPFRPLLGEPSYTDWLAARNLDGSNVTIGYVDDGLVNDDPSDHIDGRVTTGVCGSNGADGHGMFGAALAGGSCLHDVEANTGFRLGLGIAPSVNFINIPFLKSQGPCTHDDATRARDTVINNGPNGVPGKVQNNSWGSGGRGFDGNIVADVSYTSFERTFDILTRDADSVAGGNQPLITCFSAGNDGNLTPNSGNDSPASLTRPHAAKNILTTGSSSVWRPSAGGTNINDRSLFSSQGPTLDGRIKPDFMAPGGVVGNFVGIASGSVNGFGSPVGDGFHSLSAGTSFATPQTAGGTALLVQWWQRFASAAPSPAMVKALLVNSAQDMHGGNTSDLIPNRHEGWGRLNLGNLMEPGTPTVVADGPLFKKTSGLGTLYLDQSVVFTNNGDQHLIRFIPANTGQPLKATLVWTDAPGAVSSCPSLVNNLDLELVQNGKTVLRGNAFTSGTTAAGGPNEARNNVEVVIQPNPSGFYTLKVTAVTLAGDGIPAAGDTTDQDFALVVTNAVTYTGPILASGTLTFSDVCSGTGSGNDSVIDPGETVTFSVPLVNSGNAAATSVSGSLTSGTPGVSIVDGSAAYPNIPAGAVGAPSDTLSIAVADTVGCGAGVDLTLAVSTAQGSFSVPVHFDVGSKIVTTQNLTGTTGLVNDDLANPSAFTTPPAASGTIRSVSVDLNISSADESYLFDDYTVNLQSPQLTGVPLHNDPFPCSSLVTNYPNSRLAQIGTVDVWKGEDAGGVWTLRVADKNNSIITGGGPPHPASEATVNSWTLHLTTESAPACNTCVTASAPPEVSGPSSPTPLTLTHDPGTGVVTISWENQGSFADSYRLYQGSIAALAGVGVTPSNTAPVQCGIVPPTTSFVPAAGDLFFLVAGQKGALVGPLGEASDPVAFPRSADQTCP